ncbi:MAG: oligosaccharide flippase family protein [Betaproteobacteria bacterium]|nr:oligosaccharide flippase family protein [Betaproteobacteria bacterium]
MSPMTFWPVGHAGERMSFRRNVVASYASQIYVTLLGIAILPLYLRQMGEEPYGLICFFSLLQSWFGLLDLGLTPTISRETARFHGGTLSPRTFRQLFRALASLFFVIAVSGGLVLFLASGWIAERWLRFQALPLPQVMLALEIMATSVALRWLGGLYRGVVIGAEQFAWLSGFNAVIATLRFPAAFISMLVFGTTTTVFFVHQLAVAILEASWLAWRTYDILPGEVPAVTGLGWSLRPVVPILKFSTTIAFTSSVWIVVTQTDKLILSGILPLSEYGYFSLAVLVASGITLITSPISSALMPRLARLHAEGDEVGFIAIYRQSTRLISVIAACVTLSLVICAEPALLAWTGSPILAHKAAPILKLYAAGNGLLVLGAFPFCLQYARGKLRYHLIGSAILIVLLLPSVIMAAKSFGGIGAGWVWLGINVIYLFGWVAYVHYRLEPGLHRNWMFEDILKSIASPALFAAALAWLPFESTNRIYCLGFCLAVGAALLLPTLITVRRLRRDPPPFGSPATLDPTEGPHFSSAHT